MNETRGVEANDGVTAAYTDINLIAPAFSILGSSFVDPAFSSKTRDLMEGMYVNETSLSEDLLAAVPTLVAIASLAILVRFMHAASGSMGGMGGGGGGPGGRNIFSVGKASARAGIRVAWRHPNRKFPS